MTCRTLVIGYGNVLRGDDALGPIVAQHLLETLPPGQARVLIRSSLIPELAAEMAEADLVIFLDAAADGLPGQVTCRRLHAAAAPPDPLVHEIDPLSLLGLTWHLFGQEPEAYLLSCRGESFDLREGELSSEVGGMVEVMVEQTRALIIARNLPRGNCPGYFSIRDGQSRARTPG
jgi:hydrogenase maturation protease